MIRHAGLALGLALLSTTALAAGTASQHTANRPGASGSAYQVNRMVSNQFGVARLVDRSLVNAWGVGQIPGGPLWVNAAGTNKSMIFDTRNFRKQGKIRTQGDEPTGIVDIPANPNGDDFTVTEGATTGPSLFMFVTTSGLVEGWNPNVDPANAITVIDRSGGTSGFKGVSFLANDRTLLVADFAGGFVDMFDGQYDQTGQFTDSQAPENFEPFNVRVIESKVYIAFAERDPGTGDEVKGAGLGFIDVFDHKGNLTARLIANGGVLNAPWGMAIAPPGFGQFAGDLLVGNFGDGKINAFDPDTGDLLGTLSDSGGNPLVIDGLWGIKDGPGGKVTFASGPDDEQNGLIGTVSLVPPAGVSH